MKSAVLKNGKVEIVELPAPDLTDRKGAIIKVHGCGLCGSDITKIDNYVNAGDFLGKKQALPVLGHEVTGEIVDINVFSRFKKGDIVALGHHYPCFICKYCLYGSYSMCETFKASNIYPSGFSEFIYVNENHLENTVFKKPENLSEEEFSFLEPLACCIRAIKRAKVDKMYNALVIGLGSIGILMVQGLKAFGVNTFAFDINEKRQKYAPFDPNIKYDAVFMTSGSHEAIETALGLVDKGGKIVVFSSVKNEAGYPNNEIYYKELDVMGSYSPSPPDLADSYELLTSGKVKTAGLLTEYGINNLQKAIDEVKSGKILKGYIKL